MHAIEVDFGPTFIYGISNGITSSSPSFSFSSLIRMRCFLLLLLVELKWCVRISTMYTQCVHTDNYSSNVNNPNVYFVCRMCVRV